MGRAWLNSTQTFRRNYDSFNPQGAVPLMRESDRHADRKLHTALECRERWYRQSALCVPETAACLGSWPLPPSSKHITPTSAAIIPWNDGITFSQPLTFFLSSGFDLLVFLLEGPLWLLIHRGPCIIRYNLFIPRSFITSAESLLLQRVTYSQVPRIRMWTFLKRNVCHSVISDSLRPPWTMARQAPLSMEFSKQEYWSG